MTDTNSHLYFWTLVFYINYVILQLKQNKRQFSFRAVAKSDAPYKPDSVLGVPGHGSSTPALRYEQTFLPCFL